MSKEAMKMALEALEKALRYHGVMLLSDPPQDAWKYHRVQQTAHEAITALREALNAPLAEPQQEPVAVPTTSYEHRKFVLVGREWYERFAAFHDDCQIGEQLTWQEKTIRQQGYENGWNDAQRYLKEPQATSPTPAQRIWVG